LEGEKATLLATERFEGERQRETGGRGREGELPRWQQQRVAKEPWQGSKIVDGDALDQSCCENFQFFFYF